MLFGLTIGDWQYEKDNAFTNSEMLSSTSLQLLKVFSSQKDSKHVTSTQKLGCHCKYTLSLLLRTLFSSSFFFFLKCGWLVYRKRLLILISCSMHKSDPYIYLGHTTNGQILCTKRNGLD